MGKRISDKDLENRLNMIVKTNKGYNTRIKEWRSYKDIDVIFEDGYIAYHRNFYDFKNGSILHPNLSIENKPRLSVEELNKRLNMRIQNTNGKYMKILNYRKSDDIDIIFDDGHVVYHKRFENFVKGKVCYRQSYKISGEDLEKRMQQRITNRQGYSARIKKWRSADDIDIVFDDGTILEHRRYRSFISRSFKYPEKIIGQRFGKLIVYSDSGDKDKYGNTIWICKCDCGNLTQASTRLLKSNGKKSCGCLPTGKQKEPNGKSEIKSIIVQYKSGAKRRNIEWNLTYNQVKKIIHQPCFYCGEIESNTLISKDRTKTPYTYNGIDRIDSTKDYSIDNVVPCCKFCNWAKSDLKQKDFYDWVQKISRNFTYDKVAKESQ